MIDLLQHFLMFQLQNFKNIFFFEKFFSFESFPLVDGYCTYCTYCTYVLTYCTFCTFMDTVPTYCTFYGLTDFCRWNWKIFILQCHHLRNFFDLNNSDILYNLYVSHFVQTFYWWDDLMIDIENLWVHCKERRIKRLPLFNHFIERLTLFTILRLNRRNF